MAKKEPKQNDIKEKKPKQEEPQFHEDSKKASEAKPEKEITEGGEEKLVAEENVQEQIEKEEEESFDRLKLELDSHKERYIRLMAEFDNYKRRTAREFEKLVESANEKLMVELIEIRENFDRAVAAGEKHSDFEQFYNGIKLIFNKFDGVLSKNGLAPFTEIGDEFNPELHDAMMKIPNEEIPEDHIVQIYEKGYRLKNHVVKHAKVIVSSGKEQTADAEKPE